MNNTSSMQVYGSCQAEQPVLKRQICKSRMLKARDAREYATAPFKGKHAKKGQYGALALRRGDFVYGDIPYDLMKASSRFSACEINLRNAYKALGDPVYGVHVCNSKGRALGLREGDNPDVVSFYPCQLVENPDDTPGLMYRDVLLAVIEHYPCIGAKVMGLGVGFCLPEDGLAYGVLPLEFFNGSSDPILSMRYLKNGYSYLEEWGSLRYGWIVTYRDEKTETRRKAFVALENSLAEPEPKKVFYRISANLPARLQWKCKHAIAAKVTRYQKKRV